MPYNYLIDGEIRRLLNIDLKDAVIVCDEAHNLVGNGSRLVEVDCSLP